MGDWDLSSDPDCKFDADTDECVDGPAPASHQNAQRFEVTTADITVHEDWDLTKGGFFSERADVFVISPKR